MSVHTRNYYTGIQKRVPFRYYFFPFYCRVLRIVPASGIVTTGKRWRGGKTSKNNRNDIWHAVLYSFFIEIFIFYFYYYIRIIIILYPTRLCQKITLLRDVLASLYYTFIFTSSLCNVIRFEMSAKKPCAEHQTFISLLKSQCLTDPKKPIRFVLYKRSNY